MPIDQQSFDLICNEVLSRIEVREARLLNWGFIQGRQALDWLDDELPGILQGLPDRLRLFIPDLSDVTSDAVIKNLEERKLIFKDNKSRYRSRFAEAIRLMYLLRQRFSDDDWQTGSRLVSDMKIFLRRRRFPDWNIAVEAVLSDIASLTRLQKNVIRALVGTDQLAKFQADAIKQQLNSLNENIDSAIVVGAGTGSGKTRTFYIPALTFIAQNKADKPFVQALALYPRVELLKDQLREIFLEARKLDAVLLCEGIPPIRIGAYYNSVIRSAADVDHRARMYERNWRRTKEDTGWVCPYMVCPECGRGALAWFDEQIEKERGDNAKGICGRHESLKCLSCDNEISGELLPLTRQHQLNRPPDILFTTTETLNRRLGDPSEHHLFGIRQKEPPRMLLMDEIHLNEGFHGSQVAYLLRRWRFARGKKTGLCIVGLSATLTRADTFFSRLTGISNVSYITPSENDLIDEGLEYNLVLKGDPASGTTLLSTSVRTIMLLGRTLDPLSNESEAVSRGAWGQRIFAFSDKLDSINRLYHILKEVENPRQPYAQWRWLDRKKVTKDVWDARNVMGQNWWLATEIEPESLSTGLFLDLTSSQYRGVDPNADVVIASSTLEVGYNDPKVGAVIQHKAPYGHASFLQRKGRAGRPRNMRPWMIVITSNYGRDRWVFQHAENLFDSVLPPMDLPLENYYVQKVQAVYALLDWLALRLFDVGHPGSLWTLLGSETAYQRSKEHLAGRAKLKELVQQVLFDDDVRDEAVRYIQSALDIDEAHIIRLLVWGKPRSIMLDVIPTMIRQLESKWGKVELQDDGWITQDWADNTSELPLPEFLPASLFSDLNLPEVLIQVPKRPQYRDAAREIRSREMLSITLGMLEFTPGKVNKRFADKDRISEAHWIPVPEAQQSNSVDIRDLPMQFSSLPHRIEDQERTIFVCRPEIFDLEIVPRHIRPTSNGFHQWSSHFVAQERRFERLASGDSSGRKVSLDIHSRWGGLFEDTRAFAHTLGHWTQVTRFAERTEVYTRFEQGGEQRRTISYSLDNKPAGIGFTIDVDALCFQVIPLDLARLKSNPEWPTIYGQISAQFYKYKLQQALGHLTNFEIDWLWQIQLSMLIEQATQFDLSLRDASEVMRSGAYSLSKRHLRMWLENSTLNDEQDLPDAEENTRLADNLQQMLLNAEVEKSLYGHLYVLWDDSDPALEHYLDQLYIHSLGALTFSAVVEMFPEVEADDLHLDIQSGQFWISELTAGGVGLISRIADGIEQAPYRFEAFLRHKMNFCERAHLADQLNVVAQQVIQSDLATRLDAIRKTTDLPRVEQLQHSLSAALQKIGVVPSRNLLVSINTRFLRPNSSADTDRLIQDLVAFWQEQEARLGCVIDLRIIATAASSQTHIRDQVQAILQRINDAETDFDDTRVFNLIQSLLWMTCKSSCPDCIEKQQRYQQTLHPSRNLLRAMIDLDHDVIVFGSQNWESAVYDSLSQKQVATIECAHHEVGHVQQELMNWLTRPVEIGYIVTYASLSRVEQTSERFLFELSLSELAEAF